MYIYMLPSKHRQAWFLSKFPRKRAKSSSVRILASALFLLVVRIISLGVLFNP